MPAHRFGGPWTDEKLARVAKYLAAYTTIFHANERARFFTTLYIDAFAGTGTRSRAARNESTATLFADVEEDPEGRAFKTGSAQNALEVGMQYAKDRKQFGKSLIAFPRVSGKLAMMAVEIMIARQLTYFSAWQKDHDKRCDLEAGMEKLLGARVAWAAADNALQIHGGNGFALEYQISRILCDARILNIFEGAAEIQAQVIARRLLD